MPTDIFLVRHGQTNSNLTRFYMGWSQEDLNETGLSQAQSLASRLSELQVTAVYSSPLPRAFSTARILAGPHNLEVKPLDDLIEINFGEWQGLYLEEIRRKWPAFWKGWMDNPSGESIPGGESFTQVAERAIRALDLIMKENRNARAIVVSHEIVLKIMIMQTLRASYNVYRRFVIHNASLSHVQARGDRLQVILLNDRSHLENAG